MKIFVINLARSVERRQLIEKQLNQQGLDYEIFTAVDGKQLTQEEINSYMDPGKKYFRELKVGEIGCFLSHYLVLKKIAASTLKSAVIVEDDIILSENFSSLLKIIEPAIQPKDAFMLYASINHPVNFTTTGTIGSKYSVAETDNLRAIFGTVAYAIGHEAATAISDHLLPINDVIDNWHRYVDAGYINNFKIIFPFIVKPSPAFSDIHHSEIVNERLGLLKQFVRKYKVFPFWQIMMDIRQKHYDKQGVDLIKLDGKQVTSKFL